MAADDDDQEGYEVGYGKPPVATRFKAGASGNPCGRPKGARSFGGHLQQELDRKAAVLDAGRRRRMTKREIASRKLVDAAIAGDHKALALICKLDEAGAARTPERREGGQAHVLEIPDERMAEILAVFAQRARGAGNE